LAGKTLSKKGHSRAKPDPENPDKLIALLIKHKPDTLLILGDVKFTVVATEIGEWHDIPDFFSGLQRHVDDISIVRGNHDANLEPLLPERVRILPATGHSNR